MSNITELEKYLTLVDDIEKVLDSRFDGETKARIIRLLIKDAR